MPNNSKQPDEMSQRIKQWYSELPEITLPNIDSEDGTHLEINLHELVQFIEAEKRAYAIEELETLRINRLNLPLDQYERLKLRVAELRSKAGLEKS